MVRPLDSFPANWTKPEVVIPRDGPNATREQITLELCELALLSAVHPGEGQRGAWMARWDVLSRATELLAYFSVPLTYSQERLSQFFADLDSEYSDIQYVQHLRRFTPEEIYHGLSVAQSHRAQGQKLYEFFVRGDDSGVDEDGEVRNAIYYGLDPPLWLHVRFGFALELIVDLDPNFVVVSPGLEAALLVAEKDKVLDFEGTIVAIRETLLRLRTES